MGSRMGEGERPEGVRHSDRSRGQRGDCERERAKASRAYLDSYVVGLGGLHRPSNIGEEETVRRTRRLLRA